MAVFLENGFKGPEKGILTLSQMQPHSIDPTPKHAQEKYHELTQENNLKKDLSSLAELIANVTEAYTVSIFLADDTEKTLKAIGHHTLSRDYLEQAVIPFGSGLIGWTAENKLRISVCPFENDATTLLCYSQDQSLKSFIAVPIIADEHLLGVISCDSKKSYAFAKLTEKILQDCARQVASVLELHRKLRDARITEQVPDKNLLQSFIEHLQAVPDEESLLHIIARLPQSLIKRNSLVVMTCDTAGSGGKFYTDSQESTVGHKLIEMIYRHKRVLCSERSVHALPFDDASKRSFLSVPFHCLDQEAGSINLLSFPDAAFSASEISSLEKIAKTLGRELERLRLIEQLGTIQKNDNALALRTFISRAHTMLESSRTEKVPATLTRIYLSNVNEMEKTLGLVDAQSAIESMFRLLKQIVRPPAILCQTTMAQTLMFSSSQDSEQIILRLKRLLDKQAGSHNRAQLKPSAMRLVLEGLRVTRALAFKDSDNIEGLIARTRNGSEEFDSTDRNLDFNTDRKVAC